MLYSSPPLLRPPSPKATRIISSEIVSINYLQNIEYTRHSMKTNKTRNVTHKTLFLKKDSCCYYVKFIFIESIYLPGWNHWSAASHWQTLSHNVVLSTPHQSEVWTHNVSVETKPSNLLTSNWYGWYVLPLC
jgi:hypothetical protein